MRHSRATEDYLEVIWKAGEWSDEALTIGALAGRLRLSVSAVSEMVKRLTEDGLLEHAPYGSILLTDEGRRQAIRMVRRHRLIETFLHRYLGYGWDEVHEEADVLEHAVSDRMVSRLDRLLGLPAQDPHGDPIPREDGRLPHLPALRLTEAAERRSWQVARVSDQVSDILKHLEGKGIGIGTQVTVIEHREFAGTTNVDLDGTMLELGLPVARAIWVVEPD